MDSQLLGPTVGHHIGKACSGYMFVNLNEASSAQRESLLSIRHMGIRETLSRATKAPSVHVPSLAAS